MKDLGPEFLGMTADAYLFLVKDETLGVYDRKSPANALGEMGPEFLEMATDAYFICIHIPELKLYDQVGMLQEVAKFGESQKVRVIEILQTIKETKLNISDKGMVINILGRLQGIETTDDECAQLYITAINNEDLGIDERILAAAILMDLDINHVYGGTEFLRSFATNPDLSTQMQIKASLSLSGHNRNIYKFQSLDILREMTKTIEKEALAAIQNLIEQKISTSLFLLGYYTKNPDDLLKIYGPNSIDDISDDILEFFRYMNADERAIADQILKNKQSESITPQITKMLEIISSL